MKSADDEFMSSIASNVMQCLASSSYFAKLDDLLSPEDNSGTSENCDGTHRLSESILLASGFLRDDFNDIYAVLRSKGACCDCEVLYNVAEKSRLKAKYWKSRASGQPTNVTHKPHFRS